MAKGVKDDRKKRRIKSSGYTPSGGLRLPVQSSEHAVQEARTLQTRKLKKTEAGGFRVASSTALSGLSVPNIAINDPRSTEEILDSWFAASESYGWDDGYVNSFVEKDVRPPDQDPELPAQTKAPQVKGVCGFDLVLWKNL